MISLLFLPLFSLLRLEGKMLYLDKDCYLIEVVVPLELVNNQLLLALDVGIHFLEVSLQCVLIAFPLATGRSQTIAKLGV